MRPDTRQNGRPELHLCDATANETRYKTNRRPQLHLCDATVNETDDVGPMEDLSFTCVMPQPMRLMMLDQWKTSALPVWCHSQWDWWCRTNVRPQLHLCDATANETDGAGPMEELSFTCVMTQPMRLMMPDLWKTSDPPVWCHSQWDWWCQTNQKTSASPVWCHSQWDWWCPTNGRPQLHLFDAAANETDDAGPNERPQLHLCDATAKKTGDARSMEDLSFTCVMPQPMRLMMPDQWKDLSFTCVMPQPMRLMMPDQWKTSASPVWCHSQWTSYTGPMEDISFFLNLFIS